MSHWEVSKFPLSTTTSFYYAVFNRSNFMTFTLMGIPGLEAQHLWLSLPFFSMFLVILISNGAILYMLHMEPTLHTPMYLLLAPADGG